VFGEQNSTWRDQRRAAAAAQILDAAWELARENGLAGLSLRDLGRRLGMATTSVYSYFDSKMALYDAMYASAWQALIDFEPRPARTDLRATVRAESRRWVRFSLADPVRFQLMSYRTIPGFEPSPASFEVAERAYAETFGDWPQLGPVEQRDIDVMIGLVNGLIGQQLANEPGGRRWVSLVDDAVDVLVNHIEARKPSGTPRRRSPAKPAPKPLAKPAPKPAS
jgi:AcrR family transcriptional regulator